MKFTLKIDLKNTLAFLSFIKLLVSAKCLKKLKHFIKNILKIYSVNKKDNFDFSICLSCATVFWVDLIM